MHAAWRKSIPAAVSALSLAATTALADPASMAMFGHPPESAAPPATSSSFWPWSKSASATPAPMTAPAPAPMPAPAPAPMTAQAPPAWQSFQPIAPQASSEISPWKHPISYISAKMPEMSIGKSKSVTHPVMPPAQPKTDAISLSVPTGPPTPEFFIFASQMCEKQGDLPQARQNLQRAISMWPNNADVLRAAAHLEDRQANMPVAENLYQRAVTANPQNAAALNDLGLCLARQGKLEPSLQVLEQAIQLQPDKPLFRNNAATVLVEMRQDQRALGHLAAVHNPAEANFNLGQLLVDRGRPADAVPYFQTALQLNPSMQPATDALVKLGAQSNTSNVAVQAPVAPAMPQQQFTPAVPSLGTEQPTYSTGPQLSYPATARTPGVGASSYIPPQYIPPVASQPGRPLQR
jgi:tetratricopeptide (TPR) repeat protein